MKEAQIHSNQASGVPLQQLPFEHKKKIIRLFLGGKDELGRRYGIYVKNLGVSPRQCRFEVYGKLGAIVGWVTSRSGKYFSDADLDLVMGDDPELLGEMAKVILAADPEIVGVRLEDKVHMSSSG